MGGENVLRGGVDRWSLISVAHDHCLSKNTSTLPGAMRFSIPRRKPLFYRTQLTVFSFSFFEIVVVSRKKLVFFLLYCLDQLIYSACRQQDCGAAFLSILLNNAQKHYSVGKLSHRKLHNILNSKTSV